jgi:hypothetical protein
VSSRGSPDAWEAMSEATRAIVAAENCILIGWVEKIDLTSDYCGIVKMIVNQVNASIRIVSEELLIVVSEGVIIMIVSVSDSESDDCCC